MQKSLRVLMIGPAASAADSRGGMATVVSLMLADPTTDYIIRSVPTYVDASRVRKLWVGVRGMTVASWVLARGDAELLHVHLAHGGSVARKSVPMWIARRAGIPIVVHAHSYDFAGWFQRLPAWVRAVVKRALTADRWLILGRGLAVEYEHILGIDDAAVTVLHNPVRLPPNVAVQQDDAPVRVVALGRLGRRKGSYDLIDAVASLPMHVRDRLTLTMCGDGEVDEIRSAAMTAGVADTVTVTGWTSPEECAVILSNSHIFALPSYSEGLPMALLEAMSHGLAPVVTPVGSIAEVVEDGVNGILVSPGAVAEIVAALSALVMDGEHRREIARGARSRAADFDVESWYTTLRSIWRDAVNGSATADRLE